MKPGKQDATEGANGWNVEQILVYIWQCMSGEQTEQKYPFERFSNSEMGKRLRFELNARSVAPEAAGLQAGVEKLRDDCMALAKLEVCGMPLLAGDYRHAIQKIADELDALLSAAPAPASAEPQLNAGLPTDVGHKFVVQNGKMCFLAQTLSRLDDVEFGNLAAPATQEKRESSTSSKEIFRLLNEGVIRMRDFLSEQSNRDRKNRPFLIACDTWVNKAEDILAAAQEPSK